MSCFLGQSQCGGNNIWRIPPGTVARSHLLRCVRWVPALVLSLQDGAADDLVLDLAGSSTDLGQLGIAHIALDGAITHVPVAAMDLHAIERRFHHSRGAEDL